MAAVLFRSTAVPVFDSNGTVVSGALAYFYLTGTVEETPVYSDEDLVTPHTNPVVANSAGVLPSIYLDSDVTYRVRVTDADGNLISDDDPYRDLSAAEVLTKIKSVDGAGSGLDADLLDGAQGAAYALLAGAAFTGAVTLSGKSVVTSKLTFREISISTAVVSDDRGKVVLLTGSTGRNLSINSGMGWDAGDWFIAAPLGTGTLSVTRSGVTLLQGGSDSTADIAAGGFALIMKTNTSEEFVVLMSRNVT